jgi:hypothetical protein
VSLQTLARKRTRLKASAQFLILDHSNADVSIVMSENFSTERRTSKEVMNKSISQKFINAPYSIHENTGESVMSALKARNRRYAYAGAPQIEVIC